MKRIALMVAALASSLALTIALVGTPAAMSATTTTSTTTAAAATAPTVVTGAPSGVTPTTATLAGTVNLNGLSFTALDLLSNGNCYFEYGPTTTYGSTAACATATEPANGSTTTTAVTAALTGLTGATGYHYQLVTETGGALLPGTPTDGGDKTFTTPSATVPPTVATAAPTSVGGTTATLAGTVNPENWSISSCIFSYSASGGTAATAPCSAIPTGATAQAVSAAVTGLAAGTAYSYSLSVTYTPAATTGTTTSTTTTTTTTTTTPTVTSATAASFTTLSASVGAPTNLASTTATLNAAVNPEGQAISDCSLYYGTAVATLTKVACSVAPASITGTSPVAVTANITGLTQKTEYLDTVVMTTSAGATVVAPLGTFTTPATPLAPVAKTTAATAITSTTATLHATVNAQGEGIRGCEFEWGVNNLTSTSTPGDDLALTELCASTPADSGNQTVSVTLKGLAPGTKYYFRVLFLTYGGYVIANTESFTTAKSKTTTTAAKTKPKLKITSVSLNKKTRYAKFKIARSGTPFVTTGFQCALVTVKNGRAGTPKYAKCPPLKIYSKLKTGTTYEFLARGGNKNGYGVAVTHKFTI